MITYSVIIRKDQRRTIDDLGDDAIGDGHVLQRGAGLHWHLGILVQNVGTENDSQCAGAHHVCLFATEVVTHHE